MQKQSLISKTDRILVAGASGMVGSALIRNLLKNKYGNKNLKGKILTPSRKELNFLNNDMVKTWFEKFEPNIVIIVAAKVGGIYANQTYPANFLLENLRIQTNLIENAWLYGVKRLLFLGSSCIYPKLSNQPIDEESLLSGYLEKTNEAYALAKITGIKFCEYMRAQYNFDCISLMPTNLYGPKDNYHPLNSHVIPSLISKFSLAKSNSQDKVICWGDGSPLREFLHVDDLAKACLFALENWDPDLESAPRKKNGESLNWLNVGHKEELSIKDLAEKISFYSGFKGEICWDKTKPNGTPRKKLNIAKIKSLGWESTINIDQGLKETLKSYNDEKENGNLRLN